MKGLYATQNRPLVIAHRGGASEAPENTLSAFQKAVETGVDGVELDILQSKDGHLVVTHDEKLIRMCGMKGSIEELTLEELKQLDFGSHFSEKYRGETIPSLTEVLDLLKDKILINIEIKGKKIRNDGREETLIKLIRKKKMVEQVIVSSFNFLSLHRLHQLAPEVRRGYLFFEKQIGRSKVGNWSKFLKPYSLHFSKGLLEDYPVELIHEKGYRYWVWTINTEEEMRKMIHQKVDAIITDYPSRLLNIIRQQP